MSARKLVKRFLVRPISPERLSTWSSRAVSTRIVDSRAIAFSSVRRPPAGVDNATAGLSVSRRPSGGKCGVSGAGATAALATVGAAGAAGAAGVAGAATPATAACNVCQSGSLDGALLAGAGAAGATAASGAGAATAAGTAASPSSAARKAAITCGSAGRGCIVCASSPNMLRTPWVAAMMVSISSGVSGSSPLRK